MANTYLLDVIKALTNAERQEFLKFMASPYGNFGGESTDLIRFYKIILKAAPHFKESSLDKEKIYKELFGNRPQVIGKLEKMMTELNKFLRIFIIHKRMFEEKNEDYLQIEWAAWLRERGLAERSRLTMSKLKSQNSKLNKDSLNKYRLELMIAEEEHRWESTYNQVKGGLNIPQLLYTLDLFYLNFRAEWENRYLLQQKGASLPNLEVSDVNYYKENSTLLKIAYKIKEILTEEPPSVDLFQTLLEVLKIEEKNLAFRTLAQFYAFLRSICTLLINNGHVEYLSVLHELQKDNLEKGYFTENGKILPNAYINICQTALRVKDIEWAVAVTEGYQNQIVGGDEGQIFYHFNLSQCLFAKGLFEKALDALPDIPSNSHYYHINKRLELKIYYELQSDLLLYRLDSFRKYVERTAPKNIAPGLREMDVNFLYILLQLAQSPPKDKKRSAQLIKRIEGKRVIAERQWLIEKARGLG